jgi:hypothetical protein
MQRPFRYHVRCARCDNEMTHERLSSCMSCNAHFRGVCLRCTNSSALCVPCEALLELATKAYCIRHRRPFCNLPMGGRSESSLFTACTASSPASPPVIAHWAFAPPPFLRTPHEVPAFNQAESYLLPPFWDLFPCFAFWCCRALPSAALGPRGPYRYGLSALVAPWRQS